MAHFMAVENAHVRADVVAAEAFSGLAREYGVTSVPTLVIEGEGTIVGAPAERDLIRRIVNKER